MSKKKNKKVVAPQPSSPGLDVAKAGLMVALAGIVFLALILAAVVGVLVALGMGVRAVWLSWLR